MYKEETWTQHNVGSTSCSGPDNLCLIVTQSVPHHRQQLLLKYIKFLKMKNIMSKLWLCDENSIYAFSMFWVFFVFWRINALRGSLYLAIRSFQNTKAARWGCGSDGNTRDLRLSRGIFCKLILTVGPSGVLALPLAAGRNEGGHYFR